MQQLTAKKTPSAWAELDVRWNKRTQLAAQWLGAATSVVDIGCGVMALRDYLPPDTAYQPVDIVSRSPDTIVIDFDRQPLPLFTGKAAAVLGVLEYLDDVPGFLRQLRQFDHVIVSYNHLFLQDLLRALKLKPKQVDWANRYTHTAIRRLFGDAGFRVLRERGVRPGENLYQLTGHRSGQS